ncbi:MAG: ABC transporter ATP-binding protein [Gammaproteobacteria bacterium]|nr:ABC transporter ATP-binding protein [Gammaproteobacteria bacterium]
MHALSVKNLTKQYSNGLVALKGINLEVEKGDFFALLGQNGAGKSTTIGIICSLVNKSSGSVSVFGHDIDKELDAAKLCIGVVPQEMNFNPFEKISHIIINQAGYYGVPRKIAEQRTEYYFKKLGLWEKRNNAALRLSGGMKRRLMIARALVTKPRLLMLDEPTAGVDIELRHMLWEFLTELNAQGTTIILTTHYLEEAEHLCKNVAIIDNGEIIEHANMKSFINRLDTQTMILDLASPLRDIPENLKYPCRLIDEVTLEIKVSKHHSLNMLFDTLTKNNINITSLRNKTNRLEELFIDLIANNKIQSENES